MRPLVRGLLLFAAVALAAGLAGCSDAMIANRDDQETPSVPPPSWANQMTGMPSPGQHY